MLNHSSYHRVRSTAAAVAVLLSAGAVVVSCDSSDPSSPAAARDIEILVDSASLDVREGETVDLKATVVDADGNPVEGARIEWASSNPDIAEVTPEGKLTAKQAGRVELTASSFGRIRDFWAWIRALPKSISIVSGNEQEGRPGEALPSPLVVYVVDRKGDPAQRIPVTFRVVGGEGSVSPASGKTDGQGRISARWTLGKPGEQRLEARVHPEYAKVMSRSSVAFTAIAQESKTEEPPVSPGKVTISVPADTMLEIGATATLQAVARDAEGILIEDADIKWSSSNPDIMTVDDMGRVVAKAAGAVLITAAVVGCTSDTQRMVVEPPPVEAQNPAAVTDLAVGDVSTRSVTLRWTAVSDGARGVAKYAIRYGSPTLNWGAAYETEVSVAADKVGEEVAYTYSGLDDGTNYQFRLVSYRGTLNQSAIFGNYSNSVSAETEPEQGSEPDPDPQSDVASVTATPASHTFTATGQSLQIEAIATNRNDEIVRDANLVWSSTNPSAVTVNSMGLITARGTGTALIIVSSVCCGAADTSQIMVVSGDDPLTPRNMPDGFEEIAVTDFGELEASGFVADAATLVTDATAPNDGGAVAQKLYAIGDHGGGGRAMYRDITSARASSIYLGIWVKFSDNFRNHSSGITKIFYAWSAGNPKSILTARGSGLEVHALLRHSPDPNDQYKAPNVGDRANARLTRGQWHFVEFVIESSSAPGVADGRQSWWVDGRLVGDYRGLITHSSGESPIWDTVEWNTIWGGIGDEVTQSDGDMYMRAAYLYVGGTR